LLISNMCLVRKPRNWILEREELGMSHTLRAEAKLLNLQNDVIFDTGSNSIVTNNKKNMHDVRINSRHMVNGINGEGGTVSTAVGFLNIKVDAFKDKKQITVTLRTGDKLVGDPKAYDTVYIPDIATTCISKNAMRSLGFRFISHPDEAEYFWHRKLNVFIYLIEFNGLLKFPVTMDVVVVPE
jgi:hypothetical protein